MSFFNYKIQELELVYLDLSKIMTNTIQQGCEAMSERVSISTLFCKLV